MLHKRPDIGRRRLVFGLAATAGGVCVLGTLAWTRSASATGAMGYKKPGLIPIVVFDDHGKHLGERELAKVIKTAAEWKKQLSAAAYNVTRRAGTERAFSGNYSKPDKPGIYRCICCDTALYDAATQFHSGTGWPSFWQPIAEANVSKHVDTRFGMRRTEITCARCDAHLGHEFHDGPPPTGRRYCMNSVALRFVPTVTA